MLKFFIIFFLMCLLLVISCQKELQKPTEKTEPAFKSEFLDIIGDTAKVAVNRENVRVEPNGKVIGALKKGETVIITGRLGNWCEFDFKNYDKAFIWAPSLGYEYLNTYSPYFYFDTTQATFYPLQYFQTIFSQEGIKQNETSQSYEIFFNEVGFGSHQETVLEVVTESEEVVQHGIILFVYSSSHLIEKVRADFYRPIKGYIEALKKCDLPRAEIAEETGGHLTWPDGTLLKEITVDLERKEWESNLFSSVLFWK